MIKSRKPFIFIVVIVIFLFILLRSLGFIDFNLYSSKLYSNDIGSIAHSNELGSYNIIFNYNSKNIYNYIINKNDEKPILINANIKEYEYKGNYYLPLYKNFTMDYKCSFGFEDKIKGRIEGSINGEIIGLCSVRKAKEISEAKAFEAIKKYVVDSLSK